MTWISGTILALGALLLAIGARSGGRGSDAAGRAMASAYLTIAVLAWCVVAGLFFLGLAIGSWFLQGLPTYLAALPLVLGILAGIARGARFGASRMPTLSLRRLEQAARDGNSGGAKELIAAGVTIPDAATGRSLLKSALRGKYARDVVEVLLDAGADPRDPELLALALDSTHADVLAFIRHGADPNTVLPSGEWLLFEAMYGGRMDVAEALVRAGADPNRKDRDGWPFLLAHVANPRAFGPGNWFFVRTLMDMGADPSIPGPDGSTVRDHFAKATGFHPDHVDALRARLG